MSHLSIPADLLYKDSDNGSGENGYEFQNTCGKFMRFDPGTDDGAILGSFVPPDDWDGTIRVSGTFTPAAQASAQATEFYIQARVCNDGEVVELPQANDTKHTVLLLIPGTSNEPVLTWGPINPFSPDGNAFSSGALVTFRLGYNATSVNTTNTGAILLRAVNFDL